MKVTEAEWQQMNKPRKGEPAIVTLVKKQQSQYRSKLEAAYATYLHGLQLAGDISLYRYEPMTIKLTAKVRYTPDFYVRLPTGREDWHEVERVKVSGPRRNSRRYKGLVPMCHIFSLISTS
jgi:hypothetical protein